MILYQFSELWVEIPDSRIKQNHLKKTVHLQNPIFPKKTFPKTNKNTYQKYLNRLQNRLFRKPFPKKTAFQNNSNRLPKPTFQPIFSFT